MARFLVKKAFLYGQILRQPGEVVEVADRDADYFTAQGAIKALEKRSATANKAAPAAAQENPPAAPSGDGSQDPNAPAKPKAKKGK